MLEAKENRVSVKIRESTRDILEEEKKRRRKVLRTVVFYEDLIAEAVAMRGDWVTAPPPHPVLVPPAPAYAEANAEWHRKLEGILQEGTDSDRNGIHTALDWAFNCIRGRTPKKRSGGS